MPMSQNSISAPEGYTYGGALFGDFDSLPTWRWLVIGNLWALAPLAAAVGLLWLPYQLYVAFGAPLKLFADPQLPTLALWIIGAVVVVASMLVHEGIHGLVLWLRGCPPRFSVASGYLFATIREGQYLTRTDYLLMVLAPIVSMTLGGGVLLVLLPVSLGQIVLVALLLNAAASVGDLAVAGRVRSKPAGTLFADINGIQYFVFASSREKEIDLLKNL